MADLISRAAAIDAIVSVTAFQDAEYIKNLCQNPANSEDWLGGVYDAINAVEDVNAVNAALVVRCRDCVHCFSVESDPLTPYDGESAWYCDRFDFDVDVLALDPCRFYCADGERRDEDETD
jgi:hypothetical protein